MTKVFLFHQNSSMGPGAVARNLEAGLREIGVEIVKQPGKADYIGCLQNPGALYSRIPENALMGPNLFVLPFEAEHLCNKFYNFVVPSQWVKDKYEEYDVMKGCNIDVWPVGIDTEAWKPSSDQEPEYDCFIYHKNTSLNVLNDTQRQLQNMNQTVAEVLKYGFYREHDLLDLCSKCKYAVLLTGTESQGIAYMQILSTGTPCFVLDQCRWNYEGRPPTSAKATSAPYFDSKCGEKVLKKAGDRFLVEDVDLAHFQHFLEKVDAGWYDPRGYILNNHTLAKSAEKYLELLKKTHG